MQIVCKNFYVQKLFLQFHFAISPFSFYKLLMLLWNSFANSWDLKIYFLKGIVELERYEAWNLALQINDVTSIKCGNAEICWAKNPVVSFIFRLQLISNLNLWPSGKEIELFSRWLHQCRLFSSWRKGQKISRSHFVDIERGINKRKVF